LCHGCPHGDYGMLALMSLLSQHSSTDHVLKFCCFFFKLNYTYVFRAIQDFVIIVFSFCETRPYHVVQAGLEIAIFLPQPPEDWDYRCILPCPFHLSFCLISLHSSYFFFSSPYIPITNSTYPFSSFNPNVLSNLMMIWWHFKKSFL
jgi:hypothetical protein